MPNQEWSPQEKERVFAWFFDQQWHPATVRRLFEKDGQKFAEVLWDSEYSTSELSEDWLAPASQQSSNEEAEASRPKGEDDEDAPGPEELVPETRVFAPPPGLEGMNLLEPVCSDPVQVEPEAEVEKERVEKEATEPPVTAVTSPPPKGFKANVPQPPTAPPSVPPSVMVARPLRKRGEGPTDLELRSFQAEWQVDDLSMQYLKGLPGKVQKETLEKFKAPPGTACVAALLHKYARTLLERMWDDQLEVDVDGFIENWSLEPPTIEFMHSLTNLELKKQVIWGFHPKEGKPIDLQVRRFAQSIAESMGIPLPRERSSSGISMATTTTKATENGGTTPVERELPEKVLEKALPPKPKSLQEELLGFIQRCHVKGVALQTLKGLPAELLKQVLSEFEPKNGPREVEKELLNFIKKLQKAQPKAEPETQRPKKPRREETKAKTAVSKTPEAESLAVHVPKNPAPEVEQKEAPKKVQAQEKLTGVSPLLPIRAVPKAKPKTGGFALLHESTSEEEPEESNTVKQKSRKKEEKGSKSTATAELTEEKSKKTESKTTSKDGDEKKSKKKDKVLAAPAQCEMESMEVLMQTVPVDGKKKSKRQPEPHEVDANLWPYDKMCLADEGIQQTESSESFGYEHDLPDAKVDATRSKNISVPLEEESTACHGSEIFDESGSEGEDLDAEKEERRRMLRERATQRIGRTRRNQKTRLARPTKSTDAQSGETCTKKSEST